MLDFTYEPQRNRIIFGNGVANQVGDELARLKRQRALILASPDLSDQGDRLESLLADTVVGRFDGATMHTPVEVTEQALELFRDVQPDCVVAVGGGSTTGLSKALAARTDVDQIILPTTYAGSEVTPVLGETENGKKTTRSSPAVLPETVIYDVELTLDLPLSISVTSGFNALAHAAEALYSPQANPAIDAWAQQSISSLARGIRGIHAQPSDMAARTDLLVGAWLAASCLASVGMGLHHKLCHTLGGSCNLPHSPTHTVVLPYALAYNAQSAPEAMQKIAAAINVDDAATGIYDLIASVKGPLALRDLGLQQADIPDVVKLATAAAYPNPRPVTESGITELLQVAWNGDRPSSHL
jgi:alcohol dehydrogenase class IV